MSLHVQRQVVRPAESSLAQLALERSVARVLPLVSRQLVAAGKPPSTALPVTHVRLLSGVGPQVRLQVRGLRVGLGTA